MLATKKSPNPAMLPSSLSPPKAKRIEDFPQDECPLISRALYLCKDLENRDRIISVITLYKNISEMQWQGKDKKILTYLCHIEDIIQDFVDGKPFRSPTMRLRDALKVD